MKWSQGRLFVVVVALAAAMPADAQGPVGEVTYSCAVDQESAEGQWRARRDVKVIQGIATAGRDTYEWEASKIIDLGPGVALKWRIDYDWPSGVGRQRKIPETDIMVDLRFSFEAQGDDVLTNPERSYLHFYRSAANGRGRHSFETSLNTTTLWHQYGPRRLSTRGIVSLDDLLSFGTGRDLLEWELRSAPGEYGRTSSIAKGDLPLAAMRSAALDILKLRSSLDRQAANFRKHCQILQVLPVTVGR